MSHTHTPVSASVIKSTSRFAPKAIPRKKRDVQPEKPILTAPLEGSESEEDLTGSQDKTVQAISERTVSELTQVIHIPTSANVSPVSTAQQVAAITVPTLSTSSPSVDKSVAVGTDIRQSKSPSHSISRPRKRRKPTTSRSEASIKSQERKSQSEALEETVASSATTTMSEMCVDKRTGRKSSRYGELQEAERQRRRQLETKRAEVNVELEVASPTVPTQATDSGERHDVEEATDDDRLQPLSSGTARVITDENGNIVLDQSSLQINRHAAHPSSLTASLVHTTETVFSSKVNSSTYASNRSHATNNIRWLPSDNERFYEALQMFGTDFQMISDYLGNGKTRRHVKNKFDREEKTNEAKITWALKNKKPVDAEALQEMRGVKLKNREELKEELERLREEREAVIGLPPVGERQVQGAGSRSIIADAIYMVNQ